MLAPEGTAVPKTLSDKGHVHKDAECDCIVQIIKSFIHNFIF